MVIDTETGQEFATVKDIAEVMQKSSKTVYRYLNTKEFKFLKSEFNEIRVNGIKKPLQGLALPAFNRFCAHWESQNKIMEEDLDLWQYFRHYPASATDKPNHKSNSNHRIYNKLPLASINALASLLVEQQNEIIGLQSDIEMLKHPENWINPFGLPAIPPVQEYRYIPNLSPKIVFAYKQYDDKS